MKRARGFTLMESLITLVVLSVGLLGAAALLLDSLRHEALALRRTAAIALVKDMVERIRAHPAGLAADDLAAFTAAANLALPNRSPQAAVAVEPAIGPAPGHYTVSLRWREARDVDSFDEVSSLLVAQLPVAGP